MTGTHSLISRAEKLLMTGTHSLISRAEKLLMTGTHSLIFSSAHHHVSLLRDFCTWLAHFLKIAKKGKEMIHTQTKKVTCNHCSGFKLVNGQDNIHIDPIVNKAKKILWPENFMISEFWP